MKCIVTDIIYDTDGKLLNLPRVLEIEVPDELYDTDELYDFIGDEIYNMSGFCHKEFSLYIINAL